MSFILERLKSFSNSLLFIGTIFVLIAIIMLFCGRWETLYEGGARQSGGAKFFLLQQ